MGLIADPEGQSTDTNGEDGAGIGWKVSELGYQFTVCEALYGEVPASLMSTSEVRLLEYNSLFLARNRSSNFGLLTRRNDLIHSHEQQRMRKLN
jgi:hypothetical protein